MTPWFLLDSGPGEPAFNMALDEALWEAASRLGRPALRFYGWSEPAATFGYFQKYAEVERATPLRPLIRRPTGGGIVPHNADWTYSLAFPPGHEWHSLKAEESYRRVHEWLQSAFKRLKIETELALACRHSPPVTRHPSLPNACFVGHVKFDPLWRGQKIAGAAQRRNQRGLLIQGSVQPSTLRSPDLIGTEDGPPVSLARTDWQKVMCEVGRVELGMAWSNFEPDDALRERAEFLVRDKYSQPAYNRKR